MVAVQGRADPSDSSLKPFAVAAFAGGIMAVIYLWTWHASTLWDRALAPLLLVPLAWTVFAIGVANRSGPRWLRPTGYGVLTIATVGLLWLGGSGTIGRWRWNATFSPLEAVADDLLSSATAPNHDCVSAPVMDYGALGAPDEVCLRIHAHTSGSQVRTVDFRWGQRSLMLERGALAEPMGRCVADLADGWSAGVPLEDSMNCPQGFRYAGAG